MGNYKLYLVRTNGMLVFIKKKGKVRDGLYDGRGNEKTKNTGGKWILSAGRFEPKNLAAIFWVIINLSFKLYISKIHRF